MVTSQQILSAKKCGDIFSSDCKQDVIAEYREIARVYHPDISTDPKANEVMAKVNQLYEEALRLIDAGTWEVSNQIILKDKSGRLRAKKTAQSRFPPWQGDTVVTM